MLHFERQNIPLRALGSGATLSIPIFRFTGGPGKKVYIQANIHGPEIAGCGAIYELLQRLREETTLHGDVTLVPSINPVGLDTKINNLQVGYMDFNDTSTANWNRIYSLLIAEAPKKTGAKPQLVQLAEFVAQHRESDIPIIVRAFREALAAAHHRVWEHHSRYGLKFSHKLALTVQAEVLDCDYVVDLHTAGEALHHLYTFDGCMDAAKAWQIPYAIELEDNFSGALDEAFLLPWMRLQQAFKAHAGRDIAFGAFDKEVFTLELGNADSLSRPAMVADAARILNYLRAKGILEGEAAVSPEPLLRCTHENYVRYAAPTGGFLVWEKPLGAAVVAGETFATVLRPFAFGANDDPLPLEVPIRAREDGLLINRTETHVVQEGMSLCAMLTHTTTC